jgi:hypothetical protein
VDKTALVAEDIRDGKALIEALDKAAFSLSSALWYHSPELMEWRLVVATPLMEQQGPIEVYSLIQSVLQELPLEGDLSLDNISVASPGSEIIQRFLRATRGSHLAEGLFTGDAYIYRLREPPKARTATTGARVNAAKHRDTIQSRIEKLQGLLRNLPADSSEAGRLRQEVKFLEERRREFDAVASKD